MNTKTFRGTSTNDIMKEIKEELGEEAVIISTRSISNNTDSNANSAIFAGMTTKEAQRETIIEITVSADGNYADINHDSNPQACDNNVVNSGRALIDIEQFESSINSRSSDIYPSRVLSTGIDYLDHYSDCCADLTRILRQNGVRDEITECLIFAYLQLNPLGDSLDPEHLASVINSFIPCSNYERRGRVLSLVGTQGVGKTSTAFKLAGKCLQKQDRHNNEPIGIINICHRMPSHGNTRELYDSSYNHSSATLAGLLSIEHITVEHLLRDASLLPSLILSMSECYTVLIDTPGYGLHDSDRIACLAKLLSGITSERMLVIPASGNYHDLQAIFNSFAPLQPSTLSVNKIDQTTHFGPCFSNLVEQGINIEFFGTGQNLDADIEDSTSTRIIELLTRSIH